MSLNLYKYLFQSSVSRTDKIQLEYKCEKILFIFIIILKRFYFQNMSYSDDDLRNAVNAVFDAYDKDKSGTL